MGLRTRHGHTGFHLSRHSKPAHKAIQVIKKRMPYYYEDPCRLLFEASQGSTELELQVQFNPNFLPHHFIPLRIRIHLSHHRNLTPKSYFPDPLSANISTVSLFMALKGLRRIDPSVASEIWIPLNQITYNRVKFPRRRGRFIFPPAEQINHNGQLYDDFGSPSWVGRTRPPSEAPRFQYIEDWDIQKFLFTTVTTSKPCQGAYGCLRVDAVKAAKQGCYFYMDFSGKAVTAQPIPINSIDQGLIMEPERLAANDHNMPEPENSRKPQIWTCQPSGRSDWDRVDIDAPSYQESKIGAVDWSRAASRLQANAAMYRQLLPSGISYGQQLRQVPKRNLLVDAMFLTKDDLQESHKWHTLHALWQHNPVGIIETFDPRPRWTLCIRDSLILNGYKF